MVFLIRLRLTLEGLFIFLAGGAREVFGELLDGLDGGLAEVLRMIGIDRASRSQRRAAQSWWRNLN